jgi:hypothetical protein
MMNTKASARLAAKIPGRPSTTASNAMQVSIRTSVLISWLKNGILGCEAHLIQDIFPAETLSRRENRKSKDLNRFWFSAPQRLCAR